MNLLHNLGCILKVSSVRGITFCLYAESCDFLFCLLGIFVNHQVRKCHVSSFRSKFQRDCLADAAGCARHDGNFSV